MSLVGNRRRIPIEQKRQTWTLLRSVANSWEFTENSLQWLAQTMFDVSGFSLPLDFDFFPLPLSKGYLHTHRSLEVVQRFASISHNMFVPLMAMCSIAISLYNYTPPHHNLKMHWLEYLSKVIHPPPHLLWLRSIGLLLIAKFRETCPHVGVIINMASYLYMNLITPMMEENIPIWFYWGNVNNSLVDSDWRMILAFRPTLDQIRCALNECTLPMDVQDMDEIRKSQWPDPNNRQREGDQWQQFFVREGQRSSKIEACEDERAKMARLQCKAKPRRPGKRGAHVYVWMDVQGFLVQTLLPRGEVDNWWDKFTQAQQHYNGFTDEWDLCETFAPSMPVKTWEQYEKTVWEEDSNTDMPIITSVGSQVLASSSFCNPLPVLPSNSYIEHLSSLLGPSQPLREFELPHEDSVICIYNRFSFSVLDDDLSDYISLPDNDLDWDKTKKYLALDQDNVDVIYRKPLQDFIFTLLSGRHPPCLLWVLSRSHTFPLNMVKSMFKVHIWRIRDRERPIYV
ncbi:hypothetical protein K439DRAFT_1624898 [Ramaria rubella]|nr:hypothetical protein K439DRAFT_1624898 [Ramaria rubella]